MTHAIEARDEYAEFRPSGHVLMLLLRASAVDDGHGGPWLTLARSYDNPRVYVHHIGLTEPTQYTRDRIVMCSGVEVLGKYAQIAGHMPMRITVPSRAELRELADWCVKRVNAPLWARDGEAWLREYMGTDARERRANEREDAAASVRALRWLLAEEWLR